MSEFDKIFLVWRADSGERRHIVGSLEKKTNETFIFYYLKDTEELINEKGFIPYTEFPDIKKTYTGNVVDIFAQRLIKLDRRDSRSFYDFWEVDEDKLYDKFHLLGKTQGLVSTDNFEFLAEYHWQKGLHFLTEVAGLSHKALTRDTIKPGDILTYKCEEDNEYDPYAVELFKDNLSIGYIKKIHNKVFHDRGCESLRILVKAIEQNGFIKKAFIKVFADPIITHSNNDY